HVQAPPTVIKGQFKLTFDAPSRDGFSLQMASPALIGQRLPRGSGAPPVAGTLSVAGVSFPFQLDMIKMKSLKDAATSVRINDQNGLALFTVKKANLGAAFKALGAVNGDVAGANVNVPVRLAIPELSIDISV